MGSLKLHLRKLEAALICCASLAWVSAEYNQHEHQNV